MLYLFITSLSKWSFQFERWFDNVTVIFKSCDMHTKNLFFFSLSMDVWPSKAMTTHNQSSKWLSKKSTSSVWHVLISVLFLLILHLFYQLQFVLGIIQFNLLPITVFYCTVNSLAFQYIRKQLWRGSLCLSIQRFN